MERQLPLVGVTGAPNIQEDSTVGTRERRRSLRHGTKEELKCIKPKQVEPRILTS